MAYLRKGLVGRPLSMGATYTDDTPCGQIPAGDPYRTPGHWCMYNGQMLQFDDKGLVHPDLSAQPTTVGPGDAVQALASQVPGGMVTIVAGAGLAAWFLFGRRK